MNIVLPAIGSAGDVNPMIALGKVLRERGHQATVATSGYFRSNVEHEGLGFIELGTAQQFEEALNNPDLWHPRKGFETVAKGAMIPAMRLLYDILAQMDRNETIVVAPGTCFGARIAQEKLGMALVTVHLQPSMFISAYQAPVLGVVIPDSVSPVLKQAYFNLIDLALLDRILAGPINTFRAELGLAPVKHIWTRWMHSTQKVIGLFPEWYAPIQPDWPVNTQLTGFVRYDAGAPESPIDVDLAKFLDAGDAPIVFTPGSAMQHAHEFFATSVAAAQALGKRALLITQHRDQLPEKLPDTIRHVGYIPFSEVFPRTAAVVHHGGIGTTAQTLAAGIPHLVVPFSHDQPDNAVRLEKLGVGEWLTPAKYKTAEVITKLEHLLNSPDVNLQVKRYAKLVNFDDALKQTCEVIEQQVPIKH